MLLENLCKICIKKKLYDPIKKLTLEGMPILGICVGFQSLFTDL